MNTRHRNFASSLPHLTFLCLHSSHLDQQGVRCMPFSEIHLCIRHTHRSLPLARCILVRLIVSARCTGNNIGAAIVLATQTWMRDSVADAIRLALHRYDNVTLRAVLCSFLVIEKLSGQCCTTLARRWPRFGPALPRNVVPRSGNLPSLPSDPILSSRIDMKSFILKEFCDSVQSSSNQLSKVYIERYHGFVKPSSFFPGHQGSEDLSC
jgi:hypothetical protein